MKRISLLSMGVLLLLSSSLIGQVKTRNYYADDRLVPRERQVDMQHLFLDVSFEPEKKLVKGKVKERFKVLRKSVDSLFLDGIDMRYESVKLDGKTVEFQKQKKGLLIYFQPALSWGSEHEISITYEANPAKGLYFVGWDDPTGRSRKQIWTQGQGIDNRHWIPMYDEMNDKLTTEIKVSFDEKYKVLSNGVKLKEKKGKDGNKTWHYKMSNPHPPYLIMLGIGDYAIESRKSAKGTVMDLWYYPEEPQMVEPTYRYSVEMFDFFEKEIGVDYPWERYAQIPVQDFMYGAMENTTATIFGDFYLVDDRAYLDKNYVRVNAHELAHQWFGDMVTARAAAHHWLQESFATHYDMMYQGEAFGQDHFDWVRRDYNNQALKESKKNYMPIAHSRAGTVRHYPKGAFVLQMLKDVVGREAFNKTIQYYLQKHAYGNVDSEDLLIAFHEKLGLSLDWFWEQWVYKGGEPHYQLRMIQSVDEVILDVAQVHERNDLVGLFQMPIRFEVHYKDGSIDAKTVKISEAQQNVRLKLQEGKTIAFVLFDPNNRIMRKLDFDKPKEMWMAQAAKAPFMLDRYDAILAMRDYPIEEKRGFLIERFKAEKFHGIQSEIIAQLQSDQQAESQQLVAEVLKSGNSKVKAVVLANTFRINAELEPAYRSVLDDSSYQNVEEALELLCFLQAANTESYLNLTKYEMGNRSHNVRIKWLEIAYPFYQQQQYIDELVDYTSASYEFRTRVKAAQALKQLNYLDEAAIGNLLQAMGSFNSRLRGPVKKVVDHFYAQDAFKRNIINYIASNDWDEAHFRKINKYLVP